MTKKLLLAALLSASMPVMAQQVSVQEAQSRALDYLQQTLRRASSREGNGSASDVELSLAYTSQRPSDQRPLYYVFNQGQDQGFVIVGGDECAEQILGYSQSGSFDPDHLPDNFRWWLSQYDAQISAGIDQGAQGQRHASSRRAIADSRHDIGPLVAAKWGQKDPYNRAARAAFLEQTGYNVDLATGCVATATAQVMKHYNWPKQGKGSHTDYTYNYNINGSSVPFTATATFEGVEYDWNNMLILADKEQDSYSGSFSEEEANAVATLMYHVGVAVDMKYGNTSGASAFRIRNALTTYFGYDKSARYLQRVFYNDTDWEEIIYNELANGRPVLYGGQGIKNGEAAGGHQFICDGYDSESGLYYFNWGWGSFCDGTYAITGVNALKPNGSGTGGAGEGAAYIGSQDINIGIKPDAGGKELPCLLETEAGTLKLVVNGADKTCYAYTHTSDEAPASVSMVYYNFGHNLTEIQVGVRAYDPNTGIIYFWKGSNETAPLPVFNNALNYSYSQRPFSQQINLSEIPYNGSYEIRPVARPKSSTSDDDWVLIDAYNTDDIPLVIVTGAAAVEPKDINFTISANEVQVARTVQISHDAAYKGEITYSGYDSDILTVDANGMVTGVAVGSTTITVSGASYSINGNTLFNQTTRQFTVNVTATVKSDPVVTIESTEIVTGGTSTISVEGYGGEASAITYSSSDTDVATVANGIVTGVANGTATITVDVPATATSNAAQQQFTVTVSGYSLKIIEEPYMTNDAENLHAVKVKVKNVGPAYVEEIIYATFALSGSGSGNYNYSCNFEAGYSATLSFDISQYENYLSEGDVVEYKFYHDQAHTLPFAIPSYSYTYHTEVPSYTLSSAGWGTITMPVASAKPTGVDWKFYSCTSLDGDVLVLTEVSTLERNKPYIVSGTKGTASFTDAKWVDSRLLFTDGLLNGVLSGEAYDFQQGDYILQNQGGTVAFYQVAAGSPKLGTKASALRAFLRMPSSQAASASNAVFFPEVEGISQITADAPALTAGIYSLDGTRRAVLQPGMNIVVTEDGEVRKMFVK